MLHETEERELGRSAPRPGGAARELVEAFARGDGTLADLVRGCPEDDLEWLMGVISEVVRACLRQLIEQDPDLACASDLRELLR
jgi:hypothetical protein